MGINEEMTEDMEKENLPFVCPECKKPGILNKNRLIHYGKISFMLKAL